MSLIHWWPLNGDTEDKVGNKHGTLLGTATLTEPGKLGTCLSGGNGTKITAGVDVANCNLLDEISTEYSAAMWIKVHGTHVHYEGAFISSGDWNNKRWTFGINQANNRIQPLTNASNQNYVSLGKTLTNNQWYHVVTTYKDGKASLYLDGVLINTITAAAPYQSSATNLTIGRETYAAGYFSFNGDICDVRIYDHALSKLEVRELSKALVIHYKFDDILAETTTNLLNHGDNSWSKLTVNVTSKHQGDGHYIVTTTTANNNAANGQIRCYFPLNVLTTGTAYSFSCKYKVLSGTGNLILSDWCDSYITNKQTIDCGDFIFLSCYCATTRTYNSTYRFLDMDMDANSQIEIWDIQLQTNAQPTPYTLGTRESMLRNETGYMQPVIVRNLELTTDTNCGEYAGVFDMSKPTQISTALNLGNSTDVSVVCWLYLQSGSTAFTDNALYCVLNGTAINLYAYGRSNSWLYSPSCLTMDTWNHVAVVYSATERILYVNGAEIAKDTISGTFEAKSSLDIGFGTSTTRGFNGKISDFRVYRTALSAADIADIYQSRTAISKLGDIITQQFKGGQTVPEFKKNYEVAATFFAEDINPTYERLEYLESTGTQYIDTGYVNTTNHYGYWLDMEWGASPTSSFYSMMGFMASSTNPRAGVHSYSGTYMIGANATTNSSVVPITGERTIIYADFKSGDQRLYKDGTQIANNTTSFNHSSNTLTTYIFARNNSGQNRSKIRVYEAKMYEGNTVVRHYLPARRKSDGVLGLYETYTKEFLVNVGTSTFITGPALSTNAAAIHKQGYISARNIIEI